jgi:hypothetical protein
LLGLAGAAGAVGPVDLPASNEPRVPVATCRSGSGLVSSRGTGEHWTMIRPKEQAHSRDLLLALPGTRAFLRPLSGGVELTLWGNLPQLSDSPVLESAVVLHDGRGYALDLTLVRGRIVLANTRDKGPARIWLRAQDGVELTLPAPGDTVALEQYGRWPRGVPFTAGKPGAGPVRQWEVHVLKGKLDIKTARTSWSMEAPPGAAYFRGDSVSGPDEDGPRKRDKVPDWWADPKGAKAAQAKAIRAVLKAYRGKLKGATAREAAIELMKASDKDPDMERARATRQLVVYAHAALDHLTDVVDALDNPNHPGMRQAAVVALRHWIGDGPGRDQRVYDVLTDDYGFSKAEADTVLQLLHSPFDPEQPETYEVLIDYLKHARLAVRELAHWHLQRLAPAGRKIPYDAAAPPKELEKAVAQWRKLIPSGEVPGGTKKDKDKKK